MLYNIQAGTFAIHQFYHTDNTPERTLAVYEIELIESGDGASFINGVKYPHRPGNLLFAKPGDMRFTAGRCKCRFLKFCCEDPLLCSVLDAIPTGVVSASVDALAEQMNAVAALCRSNEISDQLKTRARVYRAVEEFYRIMQKSESVIRKSDSRYMDEVLRAKAYIDENYASHMNLDTLAQITYLSKNFLRVQFVRHIGISPHEYLLKVRLANAQRLLSLTGLSLAEIAVSCGYDSQAYMNYVFKRTLGISPLQYRKQEMP